MATAKLILFALIVARVAGLTMTAPIYGTNDVPVHLRVLLAITISALIMPLQWATPIVEPSSLVQFVVLLGGEAVLGACLGLGVLILIHAMTLAGELIGHASGLSLADIYDPTLDDNVPIFSRLFFLVAVSVFLCLGGHRVVMAGLLDTFQTIPPGGAQLPESLATGLVTLVRLSFSLAIRAAAPALTALMLATLVLGLVSRTLPQLNILSVGFGINALLAFAVVGLTLGGAAWAFQDQIEPALEILLDTLHAKAQPEWLS